MEMELTPQVLALIPVVAAIVQLLKRLPIAASLSGWLPIVSLIVGVAMAWITKVPDPIVPGVIVGLAASGGYDLLASKSQKT